MRFNSYIVEEKEKVKVIILTSRTSDDSAEDMHETAGRLRQECEKRNQECHVFFAEESYIERDKNNIPRIYNINDKDKGVRLSKLTTVVFVRGGGKSKAWLDLLSQIERHELFCINTRETIEICSDKYRTVLCLANANIPTPRTSIVTSENGLKIAFEKIGEKFPVVVKTLTGSKGIGVFQAMDWPSLKSTLQTIWKISSGTELIIQEYVEAKFDIRVHVLGNEVIASMKRFKIKDDFRSNYSLGGEIKAVKLTEEQKEIAIRSAIAVGATWCGVDMMMGEKGPLVIEVNSSPGTEGIEKATKKNLVGEVLDYIEDKDVWTKKTIECGYLEKLTIVGIGELDAKMDTGSGSYCVIHADSYEVKGSKVIWKHNGKTYKHELESMMKVTVGGANNEVEERPIIRLDVEFYGTVYKDIRFSLSNRKGLTTDLLINRRFIKKANLVVNPARKFVLVTNVIKEGVEPVAKKPEAKPVKKPEVKANDVASAMESEPILDKNAISDFVKEFDDETKEDVKGMMDDIMDALDATFHYGKPEKGSIGWKAEERIALYMLDALKKGETKVDKFAELVHRGWSEVIKEEEGEDEGDKDGEI